MNRYMMFGKPLAIYAVVAVSMLAASLAVAQGAPPNAVPSTEGSPISLLAMIGVGFGVALVAWVIGHSLWAYKRARGDRLRDERDSVRNLATNRKDDSSQPQRSEHEQSSPAHSR